MGFFSGMGSALIGGAASLVGGMQQSNANAANLAFQHQNLAYQKWAQEKTWEREDNATQRRVSDLKAAGLSPVLAAGSAASSSAPIKTSAPQLDPRYTRGQAVAQAIQTGLSLALQQRELQQADATIAKTKAEQMAIDLQTQRGAVGLESDRRNLGLFPLREKLMQLEYDLGRGNISKQQAEIEFRKLSTEIQRYDLGISQRMSTRYKDSPGLYTAIGAATRDLHDLLKPSDYINMRGESVPFKPYSFGDQFKRQSANYMKGLFGF